MELEEGGEAGSDDAHEIIAMLYMSFNSTLWYRSQLAGAKRSDGKVSAVVGVGCGGRAERKIMRKRKKALEKGKEARRRARVAAAVPAVTRVIADKRKKSEKHKGRWLEEGDS